MGKKADPAMIAAMQAEAQNPKISMFDNFSPSSAQYGAPVNQRQTANIHGYEGAMEGIPDMTEYMSQYMQKPADPATMTPESVQGTIPIQTTNLPPKAPAPVPQKVRPEYSYSPEVIDVAPTAPRWTPENKPDWAKPEPVKPVPVRPPVQAGKPKPTSDFQSAQRAKALRDAATAKTAADAKRAADAAAAKKAADAAAAAKKDPKDDPAYWKGRESYGSMKNFDGPAERGPNNRYYLPRKAPLSAKQQQQNERG